MTVTPADDMADAPIIFLPNDGDTVTTAPVDLRTYSWEPGEARFNDNRPGYDPYSYYLPTEGMTLAQFLEHGTAWIKYQPSHDGDCTFTMPIRDHGNDDWEQPYFWIIVFFSDGDHSDGGTPLPGHPFDGTYSSLTALVPINNYTPWTFHVRGGVTYWFQVSLDGWSKPRREAHPFSFYEPQFFAFVTSISGPSSVPLPPPPPPSSLLSSSLHDTCDGVSFTKWNYTNVTVFDGHYALGAEDAGLDGYLNAVDVYDFDSFRAQVNVLGGGELTLSLQGTLGSTDFVKLVIDRSGTTNAIKAVWRTAGVSSQSPAAFYDQYSHQWIKVVREVGPTPDPLDPTQDQSYIRWYTSIDGRDWTQFAETLVLASAFRNVRPLFSASGQSGVDNVNITPPDDRANVVLPPPPDYAPAYPPGYVPPVLPAVGTDPASIPGPTDPGYVAPTPECHTILDLVREFSAQVKRAVRIVDAHTIEMVDPAEPLPPTFTTGDAADMYSTTTHETTAGEKVLSLDVPAALAQSGTARLVTNDIRLATSTWRIPGPLPAYLIGSAPVKSVAYAFTPATFEGSVEFHLRPLAAVVRP